MAVLRIEKNSDFTIMPNYPFRDMRLSFKGRGLLGTMLTLRDDWDYTLRYISVIKGLHEERVLNVTTIRHNRVVFAAIIGLLYVYQYRFLRKSV